MDATQVLQTVLSVIQSSTGNATAGNSAGSQSQSTSLDPKSVSLPQLLLLLLGTSAVRDWVKLFLLGAFLEGCRRFSGQAWTRLVECLWVTATFEWTDDTSDWLMYWLSQRKVFQSARSVQVSAYYYGLDNAKVDDLGENNSSEELVCFFPSLSRTYTAWYKGRFMTITRERMNDRPSWGRPKELLQISMLTRNTRLIRELISEARKAYKAASEHLINVYVAESSDRWKRVATQEKRPTTSVILDPGVLELVLDDAKDFLNSKKWYADRGIPFRRGYLLYGAPGAGKTSMIHSLAGELSLDIYILSLTVMGLDDNSLKALIAHLPKSCIVLIEDIDAAFTRGMKRDIADPEAQNKDAPPEGENAQGQSSKEALSVHGVTLSGLLNALDGIAAQEGRILFATTNDYSALDPALLRPGRLDLHIEFKLASKYQATELFKRFYTASSEEATSDDGSHDEKSRDEKSDSGYNSRSSSPAPSNGTSSKQSPGIPEGVSSAYVGMTPSMRTPQLSPKKAGALAEQFADIIPVGAFSMATLQGYLMAYKVRPYDAIADAPAWVEKKLQEKATQATTKGGGVPLPALKRSEEVAPTQAAT